MKILAIETSCDDTCVAIVEAVSKTGTKMPRFRILANVVSSQTEIHQKYGGVVPSLAKRAHQENLVPVFLRALGEAKLSNPKSQIPPKLAAGVSGQANSKQVPNPKLQTVRKILDREPELLNQFLQIVVRLEKPRADLIAVTHGPGLEPALWAGVNFARALSYWWKVPLIGVDHMEGHIAANFLCEKIGGMSNAKCQMSKVQFPAICLAVSGGHTQLILVRDILKYKLLGETVDDAAGEGFDKVARLIGLGFPGGPEIARLATGGNPKAFDFPRPMLYTKNYNFSFSGLKTAVLYAVKNLLGLGINELKEFNPKRLDKKTKADIAASFEQAVVDVLIAKTIRAAKEYKAKTILLAGGVAANEELRKQLGEKILKELPVTRYSLPATHLATDNAAMIAAAAYFRKNRGTLTRWKTLKADGSLKIK